MTRRVMTKRRLLFLSPLLIGGLWLLWFTGLPTRVMPARQTPTSAPVEPVAFVPIPLPTLFPTPTRPDPSPTSLPQPTTPPRQVTVRHGDSLWLIARQEQSTVGAIQGFNQLAGGVHPGMVLHIPAQYHTAVPRLGHIVWPLPAPVLPTQRFHAAHPAVDFVVARGTQVTAVADGVVEYAGWHDEEGYGNLIVIDHSAGVRSLYAHLDSLAVQTGDIVQQGDVLGGSGHTGRSYQPHLHLGLLLDWQPLDPCLYLPDGC